MAEGEAPKKEPMFSKQNIREKQEQQREDYNKRTQEMRKAFQEVASTPSGEKVLRYIFEQSGGDTGSLREDHNKSIDINRTLVLLGSKHMYDLIRINLTSDDIKKIERHQWEQ